MYLLFGMMFSFFFGLLIHFVYGWSGRSLLVAFLAPTNESLFEHLKVLMTPFLLWALAEYADYGQYMHAFVPGKVIGLWFGFTLMIGLHLLYVTLLGHSVVPVDIGIFGLSVFASFTLSSMIMTLAFFDSAGLEIIFDGLLLATIMTFAVFTVYPPHHWLFQER